MKRAGQARHHVPPLALTYRAAGPLERPPKGTARMTSIAAESRLKNHLVRKTSFLTSRKGPARLSRMPQLMPAHRFNTYGIDIMYRRCRFFLVVSILVAADNTSLAEEKSEQGDQTLPTRRDRVRAPGSQVAVKPLGRSPRSHRFGSTNHCYRGRRPARCATAAPTRPPPIQPESFIHLCFGTRHSRQDDHGRCMPVSRASRACAVRAGSARGLEGNFGPAG